MFSKYLFDEPPLICKSNLISPSNLSICQFFHRVLTVLPVPVTSESHQLEPHQLEHITVFPRILYGSLALKICGI